MNNRLYELMDLLSDLFQADHADLDFGLYRILNNRTSDFLQRLEKELLVKAEENPELFETVFESVHDFFNTVWPKRKKGTSQRIKEGVKRAVCRDGEVKLCWASRDQFYIKTADLFTDYAFRLEDGRRVHFVLNKIPQKDINGRQRWDDRIFITSDPLQIKNGELYVNFEKISTADRRKQSRLISDSISVLIDDEIFESFRDVLMKSVPSKDKSEYSLLEKRLDHFVSGNRSDYFIHRDIGGYLEAELDWHIKNSLVDIDELLDSGSEHIQNRMKTVGAVREAACKIIKQLAGHEELQKKLWLKKKFVKQTEYCTTLNRVPESLYPEIVVNKALHDEWARLYKDKKNLKEPIATDDVTIGFLKANPYLVVDTAFFDNSFKKKFISSFDDLDDRIDGVLFKGDNFHSLNLVQDMYKNKVRMIYIDPPFNTEGDGFLYKDRYRHSSWLTLMDNRLTLASPLLMEEGSFFGHIDYNEKERLRLLLDRHLEYITEIIWRIGWLSGFKTKANKFIRNHDTIYQYGKTSSPLFVKTYIPYPKGYRRRDGKKPKGEGYPLEDTWNCSAVDSLNSIQIMSFSKEKVGDDQLTQKNESLLARIIRSSSMEGDWIMDYFLGSGTTAAVAQKLGRRWIGMERGEHFERYLLPRMKKVLYGDRFGVSKACGWSGGGFFKYIRLESFEDTLNSLTNANISSDEDSSLSYRVNTDDLNDTPVFKMSVFNNPFNVRTSSGSEHCIDIVETFNWLLGLSVRAIRYEKDYCKVRGIGPDGKHVLIIWRNLDAPSVDDLKDILNTESSAHKTIFNRIYVNGESSIDALKADKKVKTKVLSIENTFIELMFNIRNISRSSSI